MPHSLQPVKTGEPVAADRFNEVIDRLNVVSGITGVYPIEVQRQAGGLQVSLARQFKAWLFQIQPFDEPAATTSDGVPYYAGVRVRLDAIDEYAAHEPADVALFDPLAKDQPQRQLHEGNWRWPPTMPTTAAGRSSAIPAAIRAVIRFRTTATLALGGMAAAVIRTWDGAAYQDGDAITVEDFTTPGRWSAVNGAEGVAVKLDRQSRVRYSLDRAPGDLRHGHAHRQHDGRHGGLHVHRQLAGPQRRGRGEPGLRRGWSLRGPAHRRQGAGLLGRRREQVQDLRRAAVAPSLKWAYATADWVNGTLNTSKVVCEAATGKDGGSAGGGTFDVWLPRPVRFGRPQCAAGQDHRRT